MQRKYLLYLVTARTGTYEYSDAELTTFLDIKHEIKYYINK